MKKNLHDTFGITVADWITKNTWCDVCQEADLGMNYPFLTEETDEIIVIGECIRCGNRITSRVAEKNLR